MLRERLDKAGLADSVDVDSAGTSDWHVDEDMDRRSRRALEDGGYDPGRHYARRFEPDWFDRRDLVLAMDGQNLADLRRIAPSDALAAGRLQLFGSYADVGDVPDPYTGGPEGFADVRDMVERVADQLVVELGRQLTR